MTTVLVITGPPAAGKTTFAKALKEKLGLPLISKDFYKEALFDHLGYSDRQQSKALGSASFEIQFLVARELLESGVGCILETAFHQQSTPQLRSLCSDEDILQVWLSADTETLIHRWKMRLRHPGHGEWNQALEAELRLRLEDGTYGPLDITGDLITIDTSTITSELWADWLNQVCARVA